MQITNESPFSCLAFESLNSRDAAIEVVVCRGTFDIVGAKLAPSTIQEPVRVSKALRVFGLRSWQFNRLKRWTLSDPEPVASVPIQYEFAFGGRNQVGDQQTEQNPVA